MCHNIKSPPVLHGGISLYIKHYRLILNNTVTKGLTMKQFWTILAMVLAVTAFPLSQALSQAPPTELEGNFSAPDNAIELRWHIPDAIPGPVMYNVYRKELGDPSFQLLTTAIDRRHDDEAIAGGTTYQYRVTAVYSGNVESVPTNIVTVLAGADSAGGGTGNLPPRNLVGRFDDRGAVELDWFGPDSMQSPSLYNVYRKSDAEPVFSMIGSAPEPEFDDTMFTPQTWYHYYVTALYGGNVESIPSNIVEVFTSASGDSSDDSSHSAIQFTTVPPSVAPLGELFTYLPAVETNPPGLQVCFELHHAPDGVSLNPSTGEITWMPASLGNFEIEIRARICSGEGEAEQECHVMVVSGTPGQLHGLVQNEAAQPLPNVRIKIFDVTTGVFVLRTRTNNLGEYQFPFVNPGSYYVRADVEDDVYEDVWFDGVKRLTDATAVIIQEDSSVAANFTLLASSDDDSSRLVTFSGVVTDSSSTPVAGAIVTALKTRHRHDGNDDNSDDDHDDFFDDDHSHGEDHHGDDDHDRVTFTDSAGAYQLTVQGGNYFVRAKAAGFFEQFWDAKNSLLEANVLSLHQDTSNINFSLIPGEGQSEGTGSIAGFIYSAADSLPVRSHVIGFRKNSMGHFTRFKVSTRSDSTGFYSLEHLPAGYYLILAKAEDEFIPTFYSLGGGTSYLDSASLVAVGNSHVSGITIYLKTDSADGLNSFSGEIEHEIEHPGKIVPVTPFAVNPLGGAIVIVKNADGQIVGSSLSNQDGSYRVQGLSSGTYTMTFQKPGNSSVEVSASLSYTNNTPTATIVNAQLPTVTSTEIGLMGVRTNWNLIAVPVSVPDLQKEILFPEASSQAFSFNGTYQTASMLEYGSGYWLKFPATQVMTIPGSERLSQSIPLTEGWNLVGSLSYPVETASIITTPSGIISSGVFGYEGGYRAATLIEPGKGYWIKTSNAGILTMEANFNTTTAKEQAVLPKVESLQSMTVSDAAGNSQTLYFENSIPNSLTEALELPPVPPAGAFDVRFSSGRLMEDLSKNENQLREYPLLLQLVDRTITITWSESNTNIFTLMTSGGRVLSRSTDGTKTITVKPSESLKIVAEAGNVPSRFALQQNYPNPFNPVTTISIDLPVSSTVTVTIYNLIGQEVKMLVGNQTMDAGTHTVQFDANALASGVYLYRLQANSTDDPSTSFTQIRKMMLLK